jgi:hypothetical protein
MATGGHRGANCDDDAASGNGCSSCTFQPQALQLRGTAMTLGTILLIILIIALIGGFSGVGGRPFYGTGYYGGGGIGLLLVIVLVLVLMGRI